jgi:hypothetical protein
MDKLKKDLEEANCKYKKAEADAYNDYINRNALAKVGDVVTDGRKPIRVAAIQYDRTYDNNNVTIIYYGNRVTKDKGEYRDVINKETGYAFQDKNFKILRSKEFC